MWILLIILISGVCARVCVAGGQRGAGKTANTECSYAGSEWVEVSELFLPSSSSGLIAIQFDGFACVVGGNPAMNVCTNGTQWVAQPGPSPINHESGNLIYGPGSFQLVSGYASTAINQSIIMGTATGTATASDPNFNLSAILSWTPLPSPLAVGRESGFVFALNGTVCIAGGGDGGTNVTRTSICTPAWGNGPNMSTPTMGATAFNMGSGSTCAVGGRYSYNDGYLSTIQCIQNDQNLANAQWTSSVLALPMALTWGSNATFGGMPCVVGGKNLSYQNNILCLNSTTWIVLGHLNYARAGAASFILPDPPSPTMAPSTTKSPTFTPTISTPAPLPPTFTPTPSPTPSMPAPEAGQGQTLVDISININNNQTIINRTTILLLLNKIFNQLNISTSAVDPSTVHIQVDGNGGGGGGGGSTVHVSLVVSEAIGSQFDSSIQNLGGKTLSVDGYEVGITLQWPSLLVTLNSLSTAQLLILFAFLLLALVMVIIIHIYLKATSHIPTLFGLFLSLFSFSSHAWFLDCLHTAAFTDGTNRQRTAALPYFAAFVIALLLPLLANAIVMKRSLPRLRAADRDFCTWTISHRWGYRLALFFGLFAVGNLGVMASPIWGSTSAAPMTRVTRASFGALGLVGAVLEVPRLIIQSIIAAVYSTSSWATALPLFLGSLFILSGFMQRCYFFGYVQNKNNNNNNNQSKRSTTHTQLSTTVAGGKSSGLYFHQEGGGGGGGGDRKSDFDGGGGGGGIEIQQLSKK